MIYLINYFINLSLVNLKHMETLVRGVILFKDDSSDIKILLEYTPILKNKI